MNASVNIKHLLLLYELLVRPKTFTLNAYFMLLDPWAAGCRVEEPRDEFAEGSEERTVKQSSTTVQ